MKTFVAPTDEIAAALHRGELSEIEIALEPQPELNVCGDMGMVCEYGKWRISNFHGYRPGPEWSCPYAPGDVVAVKEAWRIETDWIGYRRGRMIATSASLNFRDYEDGQDKPGTRQYWTDIPFRYQARWADFMTGKVDLPDPPWRKPHQLPIWAVRTRLLVLAIDCREKDGEWRWIVKVRKETNP
jgi:hypothetical protein